MDLNKVKKTFSLKGLLAAFCCLSLLLVVTIPGLMKAKIEANEGRTIGTLRTISTSQGQINPSASIDQDADGVGEYALLGELAGTKSIRANPNNTYPNEVADPVYIDPALGPKNNAGFSSMNGYYFQIYLPGVITDDGTSTPSPFLKSIHQDIIDAQEKHYRLYAWPQEFNSGRRCFAMNQKGEVISTFNKGNFSGLYSGAKKVPSFDAAVDAKEKDNNKLEGKFAEGTIAKDGQKWEAVKD